MTKPTQREITKEEIGKSFEKLYVGLVNLKGRWMDEREYEDFNEYKKVITKWFLAEGLTVTKISKTFTIQFYKGKVNAQMKIGVSAASYAFFVQPR